MTAARFDGEADQSDDEHRYGGKEEEDLRPTKGGGPDVAKRPAEAVILGVAEGLFDLHAGRIKRDDGGGIEVERRCEQPRISSAGSKLAFISR